jgi:hypothetical protein
VVANIFRKQKIRRLDMEGLIVMAHGKAGSYNQNPI